MFKFDFQVEKAEDGSPFEKLQIRKETKISTDISSIDWYDSEEILPSREFMENLDVYKLSSINKVLKDISISYMVSGFVLETIKDNENNNLDIKKAEEEHTDLIPGVYEGGAKVWECTDDMLLYLSENYCNDNWNELQVLDLGCGSGLLGIYAFRKGAKVTFQDYNKDVLEKITIPNVLLNISEPFQEGDINDDAKLKDMAQFFSGDWSKWSELTRNNGLYDRILTSETIYNPQNQQKLINCLYDKLKPDGIVLVSAKTYYFGVGGGLRQFEELIEKDKRFHYKVVWQSELGVNREIIELKKIKKSLF